MKTLPRHRALPAKKFNPFIKVLALGPIVSRPFKSMYNKFFPIGYEDKTGFHYEKQKVEGKDAKKWPGRQDSAADKPPTAGTPQRQ